MALVDHPKRAVSVMTCFSAKDREFQRELEVHLAPMIREGVISCWSQADIEVGADWREERRTHLYAVEIILLLISSNFLADPFCVEVELQIAMQRQLDRQARVVPILLSPCDWQNGVLAGRTSVLGEKPVVGFQNRDEAWHQVTDTLRSLILELPVVLAVSSAMPMSPVLIPLLKVPAAFTREDILIQIREGFHAAQAPRIVCLHGLAGQGTSRLAMQYAQRYRQTYRALFHVNASDQAHLRDGFFDIAVRALRLNLNDPHNIREGVESVRRWLSMNSGWLLILDDANPRIVEEWIPNADGDILITSHDDMQGLVVHPPDRSIQVREITSAEAVSFVSERMRRALSQEESESVTQIAECLGHSPLAMERAVALILGKRLRLRSYLERLRSRPAEALEMNPGVMLSIDTVESEGELSRAFLALFAVLDCRHLPLDILCQEHLAILGPPFARLKEGWEVEEALAPLVNYSLLSFDPCRGTYNMKQLVHDALLQRMPAGSQRAWAEKAVNLVSHSISCKHFSDWPRQRELAPLVRTAVQLTEKHRFESQPALRLLNKAGFFLIQQGEYKRAGECYRWASSMSPASTEPQTELQIAQADSHNGLGRVLYHVGDYYRAEEEFRQALSIRQLVYGLVHPETATSLNNLALLYYQMDPLRPGLGEMFRSALQIRQQTLGVEHTLVAKTQTNLGLYLTLQGGERGRAVDHILLQEAEALSMSALHVRLKLLGPGHPDVAQSHVALARVARAKRDFDRAEALYKNARRIDEEALGPRHPNVGHCLIGLARLYSIQGRKEQATAYYEETRSLWRQTLGSNHPYVAKCMFALAALRQEEAPLEAEQQYRLVLSIWESSVEKRHPDYQACLRRLEALHPVAMAG